MKSLIYATLALAGIAQAQQQLQGEALLKALSQGGYVIVMRHASSPREAPSKEAANPDNVKVERQLDKEGRDTSIAMGKALRELKIPVGEVLTSPTYRANETVRYMQLSAPKSVVELGDNGQSMSGGTEAQATWLKKEVTEFPRGANTWLVTHMPNISRAFPQAGNVADGESLVFGPDGKGGAAIVGRIKIDEWAHSH